MARGRQYAHITRQHAGECYALRAGPSDVPVESRGAFTGLRRLPPRADDVERNAFANGDTRSPLGLGIDQMYLVRRRRPQATLAALVMGAPSS